MPNLDLDSPDFQKLERPHQRVAALNKYDPTWMDQVASGASAEDAGVSTKTRCTLKQLKVATAGIASSEDTDRIWLRLNMSEDIVRAFNELDKDHDGTISRSELYKAMVGKRKAYFSELLGGNDWKHIRKLLDTDDDGEITLTELAKVITFTDQERAIAVAQMEERERVRKARKTKRLAREKAAREAAAADVGAQQM